uniref:Uncharacterized protein n=1 Tax=Anguilla anguilla TaxID=7936 RepID=A0A0E9R0L4_ANGAN
MLLMLPCDWSSCKGTICTWLGRSPPLVDRLFY